MIEPSRPLTVCWFLGIRWHDSGSGLLQGAVHTHSNVEEIGLHGPALLLFLTRANKAAGNIRVPSASEGMSTPEGALQGGSILNRSEKSLTLAVTVPKNRSDYADCAVRGCTSERLYLYTPAYWCLTAIHYVRCRISDDLSKEPS